MMRLSGSSPKTEVLLQTEIVYVDRGGRSRVQDSHDTRLLALILGVLQKWKKLVDELQDDASAPDKQDTQRLHTFHRE